MASSSKGKGAVKTVQWWKHLREWKRVQNKLVRKSNKKIIKDSLKEHYHNNDDE